MESAQSRKRGAASYPPGQKRQRCDDANDETGHESNEAARTSNNENHNDISCCSVEALLSVPLEFLFRDVSPSSSSTMSSIQRRKALLTRSEAQCLLRMSSLAHEANVLIEMASEALERQRSCYLFRQRIEQDANHPLLRPVLPLLVVHGDRVPNGALAYVRVELDRVLYQLGACANTLRQFAEQNWTLADSLLDAFGDESGRDVPSSGQELAKEKRTLAEIEEEAFVRIEHLLGMATTSSVDSSTDVGASGCARNSTEQGSCGREPTEGNPISMDAFEHAHDAESGDFVSMEEFCKRLLRQNLDQSSRGRSTRRGADPSSSEDNGEVINDADGGKENAGRSVVQHCAGEGLERSEMLSISQKHENSASPPQPEQETCSQGALSEFQQATPTFSQSVSTETAAEALAVLASGDKGTD